MSNRTAHGMGSGRTLLWLTLLSLALAGAARAAEPARIDSLVFSGLSHVEPSLVEQTLQLRAGDRLQPYPLSESVRALYGMGLFDQVRVDAEPRGADRVALIFHFSERLPVRTVLFRGNDFLSADQLHESAGLSPGQRVSAAALFRAQAAVEKAYRDEGYARAQVTSEVSPDSSGQGVAVLLRIDEGPRVKVREVRFAGVEVVSPKALRRAIQLRPGGFLRKGRFTREKLEEDTQRLVTYYQNHGFKDASVTAEEPVFTPDGRGVAIAFRITEGPQFRFAAPRWEGATVYATAPLRAATVFRAGEAFDQSKVDATVTAVNNLYTERGYLTGLRVDPVTETQGDSVRVTFRVAEGQPSHVGEIRVVGNSTTKEHVIRRELSLYPGALLRRSLLLRSQRDAFATGYFEDVQVEFAPGTQTDEVDVTFRVKEKSSIVATAGAGYSSQVGLTGFVEFGHNNLFGNGQSVSLKLEHGGRRDLYDLSFTEPWLSGRPISVGADLYKTEDYREIYAAGGTNDSYWQSRAGGGVRVGFPWFLRFPDYTRIAFGYSYTDTKYKDIGDLPSNTQDLLRSSEGALSRVFTSLNRNSTDNPFHPTLGTRTAWNYEVNLGELGGQQDSDATDDRGRVSTAFYRTTLDHRQYFVPFWKPVLMLRWRFGLMWPFRSGRPLVSGDLFRLGGTTGFDYLRGYHDYYVVPEENIRYSSDGSTIRFPGGNVMFGFTGEVQFPIVDPVHGILFFDAGDTWRSGYDVSLQDLKFGMGAGVTLEIPMLGPVGFYYGYGTKTGEWVSHFAFGAVQ